MKVLFRQTLPPQLRSFSCPPYQIQLHPNPSSLRQFACTTKYSVNPMRPRSHWKLSDHPQASFTKRHISQRQTEKRRTKAIREEQKAKEYLYTEPDPSLPLPPLLLRPPGLPEPPEKGKGHGAETKKWWQKELEIWFGRYRRPFDVKSQMERHREL
jgi:hypothetical protein